MRWVCLDDAGLLSMGKDASEQTDGPRGGADASPHNGFAAQLLSLDTDARLTGHDVLQDLVDVGLDEILHAPRTDERQYMTVYAASVGDDCRRLLWAPALPEYE